MRCIVFDFGSISHVKVIFIELRLITFNSMFRRLNAFYHNIQKTNTKTKTTTYYIHICICASYVFVLYSYKTQFGLFVDL